MGERTPAFLPRFDNWRPPELSFSTRTVLRREYNGFFAIIAVYFAIELLSALVFRGDPLSKWLSQHGEWLAFFLLGGAIFLSVRALKKHTRLLHVEGR